MMSSVASYSAPTPAPPLKRGKACLTCRYLKIRCDGLRPICTPCAAHPKEDPCEYADKPGRSRYRSLEETIVSLQSRVNELEDENVQLHGTLDSQSVGIDSKTVLPLRRVTQLETPDASEHSGSPPTKLEEESSAFTLLEEVFQTVPHLPESDQHTWTSSCIKEMITNFDVGATQFGFFLDKDHFSSLAVLPLTDPRRPCEALVASVCLWGCLVSLPESHFRALEDSTLKVALYQRSTTIMDNESNPRRLLHSVQAEVLLAYYFYRKGILIEAKNHAAAAASFVTASGMQSLLSVAKQPLRELEVLEDGQASYLPPARDIPETGELINGFWAVYTVANQLASVSATADCTAIFDAPHLLIDCPWPLDNMSYRDGILPPRSANTVETFLNCTPFSTLRNAGLDSHPTMLTKATVLLRHATVLTDSQSKKPPAKEELEKLSSLTRDYWSTLPPALLSMAELRTIYTAHALAASAYLRLHEDKAMKGSTTDLEICMSAIRDLFLAYTECDLRTLDCVSPVLGGLWKEACLFLAAAFNSADLLQTPQEVREEIYTLYTFGKDIMTSHAHDTNILLQYQLKKLPETL